MEDFRLIYDFQAERSLIGAMLIAPEKVIPEAALSLSPNCFYHGLCRQVYSTCVEYFKLGKSIDPITVSAESGGFDRQECRDFCLACACDTPAVSHYLEYIRILKEVRMKNEALAAAESLIDEIQKGEDIERCQSMASSLLKCFDHSVKAEGLTAKEGYLNFSTDLEEHKEYIQTGIPWIDRNIFISPGDYIVIGGGPSSGKTALTLQMMLNMAKEYQCVYFSLETSPAKIFERLATCYARLDFSKVKRREVDDADAAKITEKYENFQALKLEVVSAAGWTAEQIKSKAVQARADVIFVDYLTLMKASGKTPYERATQISMDLHTLAQQMEIAVIALAQLNRAGKGDPDMTSLRESGQIEQDADAILLIHWPDQEDSTRELIIAKNKEGETGKNFLRFDGKHQTFSEFNLRQPEF